MTIIVNGSNTPTAGAVGYGDGTNLAFTSAGTTGQFLSSNGSSAPSWVGAPASAMTLISTLTASSSTDLHWTGLSGYDKYILIVENLVTAPTGNRQLLVHFGYGSTPTYYSSGYDGVIFGLALSSGSNETTLNSNSAYFQIGSQVPPSSVYGVSSNLLLAGFLKTNYQTIQGTSGYINNGYSGFVGSTVNGVLSGASAPITAIQILFSAGNIASGTASLYGISS